MWLLALLLASCTLTTAATANKCGFPPPHAVASLQNGDALALRADWVAPCGRLTANKHRLLHATANGAALLDARQLLTPRRFDLGAKLAYARARLAGRRGKYALTLYGASVRALNGFAEHDPPQRAKGSLLEFALAFDSVLGIAEAGWLNATAFVPVSADDAAAPAGGEGGEEGFVGVSIVDGAHRTAAAAALGRPLPVLRLARGHAASFDFRWFRQRGLSERYAQASAVEWLRWRPQARLLLLWPAGDSAHLPGSGGGAKDARKWMSHAKALAEVATHGAIYYEGTVEVDAAADGPLLLMATLYRGEEWLGDAAGGWAGAANKRHSCFPRPQGRAGEISTPMQSVRVVVFEGDALKAKLAVRALYEKEGAVSDSHSVAHSTDTAAETAEVATLLLSESGRQFVNRVQLAGLGGGGMWDRAATQLTDTLKRWAKDQGVDVGELCVSGSAVMQAFGYAMCIAMFPFVMQAFGMRLARDVDIITSEAVREKLEPRMERDGIGNHNNYFATVAERDDVLSDPASHFVFRGVKFMSLEVLRAMKLRRDEQDVVKDVLDALALTDVIDGRAS